MSIQDSQAAGELSVCVAALPVLARHVNSARSQAAEAVGTLNRHFFTVMQQLQEMSALAAALHEGGAAAFDRIDQAFIALVDTQAGIMQAQADLAKRSGELAPLLSALLAHARATAAPSLIEQIEDVVTEVFGIIDAQERLSESAQSAGRSAETRVDAVLAPYGESLSKLAQYGDGMRAEISECLVQLQFQDRTAQILGHVTASMEQLTQYLRRPTLTVSESGRRFLQEMTRGYTTPEQHEDHQAAVAILSGQ